MFNRKKIKQLEERIEDLEEMTTRNNEAIDLIVDEMGFEITECDDCGCLCLTK